MAKFTVDTRSGLDMRDFDLDFDGDATIANSTQLRIQYASGWFNDFFGTGFTYDSEGPTGGTLTGLSLTYNNVKIYTISGTSIPVPTFLGYVSEGSVEGAVALVDGNDSFTGNAGNDFLASFGGNDTLDGKGGNDTLFGGAGNDTMHGGIGNDTYIVDARDVVVEAKGAGTDLVKSSVGFTLGNYVENLTLTGKAAINGTGDGLANVILGNDAANKLSGLAGSDVLSGGKGKDVLAGGTGVDKLTGGAGADRFAFLKGDTGTSSKTADHVTDFSHAQKDRIDLSGYDANTKKSGVQDFTFIGTKAFDGVAGRLHYELKGGDTFITGDTNGDKKADFLIILDPAVKLVGADFYFG